MNLRRLMKFRNLICLIAVLAASGVTYANTSTFEDLDLPAESSVTLNGFLCDVHGRIPPAGTTIEWEGFRFHVLGVAGHRIQKVLLEMPQDDAGDSGGEES